MRKSSTTNSTTSSSKMPDFENIKIVRLQSGEDIIADCQQDEENSTMVLNNPMHIIFKRIPSGRTVMFMMPWLPIELIKENMAIIYDNDILTMFDPKEDLIEYYNQIITDDTLTEVKNAPLKGALFDNLEDAEEDDIDEEELLNLMREKRNNRVH